MPPMPGSVLYFIKPRSVAGRKFELLYTSSSSPAYLVYTTPLWLPLFPRRSALIIITCAGRQLVLLSPTNQSSQLVSELKVYVVAVAVEIGQIIIWSCGKNATAEVEKRTLIELKRCALSEERDVGHHQYGGATGQVLGLGSN